MGVVWGRIGWWRDCLAAGERGSRREMLRIRVGEWAALVVLMLMPERTRVQRRDWWRMYPLVLVETRAWREGHLGLDIRMRLRVDRLRVQMVPIPSHLPLEMLSCSGRAPIRSTGMVHDRRRNTHQSITWRGPRDALKLSSHQILSPPDGRGVVDVVGNPSLQGWLLRPRGRLVPVAHLPEPDEALGNVVGDVGQDVERYLLVWRDGLRLVAAAERAIQLADEFIDLPQRLGYVDGIATSLGVLSVPACALGLFGDMGRHRLLSMRISHP